ncbi:ABC transporter ATP-binding protein [Halomicroarcula sp. GCM10025324]|uniref:DUF7546 family protein n=1 Tax=Haloarcula TaxID=2237 RepID=UPI0023E7722E|nr:ABC transporter ATP-binding protein [Halomicroarcula sp. ZS-22-S1]
MSTTNSLDPRRFVPDGQSLFVVAAVLNAELLAVFLYLTLVPEPATDWFILAFPFIWLNVAALVFWRVRPAAVSRRRRLVGLAFAVGYALLLAWLGGVAGFGGQGTGLRVVLAAPPGFTPTVIYSGSPLAVVLTPWKVGGYLTLTYLVYVTVLDASGGLAGGVLGLFSCVSCVLPIIASVLGGVVGVSATLSAVASNQSYGASTAVFLVSVGLLYAVNRFDLTVVGRLRR